MKQFRVFYNNNVESNQVADFDTLEQAKQYCADECKGCESVCDGDTEYEHRATTKHYEVFDGDPRVLDEDGDVVDFKEPVYETGCYYIDNPLNLRICNIQDIQNIEQNVSKAYEMLNKLGSNGLELMDLAFPNHDGVKDEKAVGELMYLRQSVNGLKNACELAIKELNDAIQDSLEYEIIKTGFRYIDNGDGTFDVCYDHSQDSYFSEINKHHVAKVREDESTLYIEGEYDTCEGEYSKKDWTFADALKNQCIEN